MYESWSCGLIGRAQNGDLHFALACSNIVQFDALLNIFGVNLFILLFL